MRTLTLVSSCFLILSSFAPSERPARMTSSDGGGAPAPRFCINLNSINTLVQTNDFGNLCDSMITSDFNYETYASKIKLTKKGDSKVTVERGPQVILSYYEMLAWNLTEKKAQKVYKKYLERVNTCLERPLIEKGPDKAANANGTIRLYIGTYRNRHAVNMLLDLYGE